MEDLKKMKETDGHDHVLLHVMFDDKFPYSPPFIRVVKPVLSGGYVLAGGAICMELLTPQVEHTQIAGVRRGFDPSDPPPPPPQGWSSAYTVEAVILQISATLVKGKARVIFTQSKVRRAAVSPRPVSQCLCLAVGGVIHTV